MKHILLLTMFCFIASCKTIQDESSLDNSSGAGYDAIIAQCSIPEGNGGNWSATIGWLSETIHKRYQEAKKLADSGKKVGVFLHCMAGSSSGSLATNILDSILSNTQLITSQGKLLTVAETKIVADSLRYVGLSADANLRELSYFYYNLAKNFVEGRITNRIAKIPFLQKIARTVFQNQTPSWWSGQLANADQILVDFIVVSHLARTLDVANLYTKSEATSKPLVDFRRFETYSELKELSEQEEGVLRAIHVSIAETLEKRSGKFVAKQFPPLSFKKRFLDGPYDSMYKVLKSSAESPLSEGFCTLTIADFYEDLKDINLEQAPPYDQVSLGVFCDKKTIENIMQSPYLKKDMAEIPYVKRYKFMGVNNKRASMAVSLREPQLMAETSGKIAARPFEVNSIANLDNSSLEQPGEKAAVILGGFSDRRISAFPISYYFLNEIEDMKKLTKDFRGYVELFGKPDNRSVDTFSTNVIRSLLSKDDFDADANVADWYRFQNSYCSSFAERFARSNVIIQTTALNWDVGKIPASQGGNSSILVKKGINAVALQTKPNNTAYVFDPMLTGKFVAERTYPCGSN